MTHNEMIAVLEADRAGKPIQRYQIGGKGLWEDFDTSEGFDFVNYAYLEKPEPTKPREWWLNTYADRLPYVHDSKIAADKGAGSNRIDCVLVREVLP